MPAFFCGKDEQPNQKKAANVPLIRTGRTPARVCWFLASLAQLGVHAIGDAAIELVVSQLAQVLREHPRSNHRHYLNHFTIRPSSATVQMMASNQIGITLQPNFTWTLEGRYAAYLGDDELRTNNPLRSPMATGY